MKKHLAIFAILLAATLGTTHAAHAAPPTNTWHGTNCGPHLAVCSNDPPDPAQNFAYAWPCYFSEDPNQVPNSIQLEAIKLCQAARGAIIVPPKDRDKALDLVTEWYTKLNTSINANPETKFYYSSFFPQVEADYADVESNRQEYDSQPTLVNWKGVVYYLIQLGNVDVVR